MPTNGRPMAKPITSHEVTAPRVGRPRGSASGGKSKSEPKPALLAERLPKTTLIHP
jgi:hypothetical protein